jgi:hypothetical protein
VHCVGGAVGRTNKHADVTGEHRSLRVIGENLTQESVGRARGASGREADVTRGSPLKGWLDRRLASPRCACVITEPAGGQAVNVRTAGISRGLRQPCTRKMTTGHFINPAELELSCR